MLSSMTRDTPAPLFHPFEAGDLDMPGRGARGILLNARADMRPATGFDAKLNCVQGFRPEYLALKRQGYHVAPQGEGESYDLALVQAGRHRGQNEAQLGEAIRRTAPGGLIIVAGGKTDGVSSLRKRLATAIPLGGHLAKNHGEVFWFNRSSQADAYANCVEGMASRPLPVEGRFHTAAGMFSHDRVDSGSQLLARCLPENLKGHAGDFCAGWGYLSVMLAERAPAIADIELFEADYAALEAARRNMAVLAPAMHSQFHWTDLAAEPVERRFDVIVMNPPFHDGRAADPGIGHAMIRAASAALKPSGQLFMVANRGLPYELPMKAGFGRVEEIADEQGFRVWRARR